MMTKSSSKLLLEKSFFMLLIALFLASCDDSSSSSYTPPSPPANSVPIITSATSVNVEENYGGSFYLVTTTDADNDPVTLSISGGADAALFQLSGSNLSFRVAADFEAPKDLDQDNRYLITLTASDGRSSSNLSLTVTVTDISNGAFRVRRVAQGFVNPVDLISLPDGSGRLLIAEGIGRIRILSPATGEISPDPLLDVSQEGGQTTGLATSPNFAQDRTLYVTVFKGQGANSNPNTQELRAYQFGAGGRLNEFFRSILFVPQRDPLGWVGFGADGYLYISSAIKDNPVIPNGVLRIDPNGDDFPDDVLRNYRIPASNPFVGSVNCPAEVWAFGLGTEYVSFDHATGFLWASQEGINTDPEEVNVVRPNQAGGNFGMSHQCAGPQAPALTFRTSGGSFDFDRIVGGVVYRGSIEALQGLYIFANSGIGYPNSPIYSISVNSVASNITLKDFTVRSDLNPISGTINRLSQIVQDDEGQLYLLDSDGEIFIVESIG